MGNTFTDKDIASQMLQAQCISAGDPRLATKQEAESTGTSSPAFLSAFSV